MSTLILKKDFDCVDSMKNKDNGKKENIALKEAIVFFGNTFRLSKKLKLDDSQVYRWLSGERLIPIKHAIKIEQLTDGKIKAKELRPDVFNQTKEVTKK